MRKINIILTASIVAFALAACGGQKGEQKEETQAQDTTAAVQQEKQQPQMEELVFEKNGITVKDPYTIASKAGQMSVVYLVIMNSNDQPDTLLSALADTSIVGETQLHIYIQKDGKTGMKQVKNIPIPAGETVELKPGGYHIMLMGLKKDINVGDTINVVLHFKNAGDLEIKAVAKEKKQQ